MKNIFQSMDWTKLCWDLSWNERIKLADILPKIGRSYQIDFSNYESHAKAGPVEILWRPPHSELNGWDDRPSEILKSFVISGEISVVSASENTFVLEVTSCTSLIELIEDCEQENSFNLPIRSTQHGDVHLWRKAANLGCAKVGKYIYISGTDYETSLEAILEIIGQNIFLVYHAYLPPASYETVITRKLLSGLELEVICYVLDHAKNLKDQAETVLESDEVQGAKYC